MITNPEVALQFIRQYRLRLAHIIFDDTWQLIASSGHPYPGLPPISSECACALVNARSVVLPATGHKRGKYENDIFHPIERVPVSFGGTGPDE